MANYDRGTTMLGKMLRAKLRARLPGLNEIVYLYANQGALLISYSPSEHGYEGVCSLALHPDRVNLSFGRGAELSGADPQKLLQGRGKSVRQVELKSLAGFDRPEIEVLMAAALKLAKLRLDASAKGALILEVEQQKQRARRAKTAARPRAKKPGPGPARESSRNEPGR